MPLTIGSIEAIFGCRINTSVGIGERQSRCVSSPFGTTNDLLRGFARNALRNLPDLIVEDAPCSQRKSCSPTILGYENE